MAFQTTLTALAAVMFIVGATARRLPPPPCEDLKNELRKRSAQMFIAGEQEPDPFLEEHKCVNQLGETSYFACKPGYEAVVRNVADLPNINDLDIVFNINQLRLLPGNQDKDGVLDCLPSQGGGGQNEIGVGKSPSALPQCNALRSELRERNVRLFTLGERETDPFLEEHKCVSPSEGEVSYFSCKSGYKAVLRNIDDLQILDDLDIVLNINQLRLLPRSEDDDDGVLDCLAEKSIGTPASADEEEKTIQASTTPPPLPMCSDVSGLHFRQFRREARPRVCEYTCRFPVSVYGHSAGFRTRRYYRCCKGEAQQLGAVFSITYTCPQ